MHRTAAEAQAHNIASMGEEIGKIYSALWQEVASIHNKWAQYVALFGTSPSRIELLNEAAPSFFRTVQDALWEGVLLHLARLSDPPRSAGKENLSIRRLSYAAAGTSMNSKLLALESRVLETTLFARDWRNRKLAHRDLELAIEVYATPLTPASRAAVKNALSTLAEFLNVFSLHFLGSTTMFAMSDDGVDAVSLLYVVRDGLAYDEERFARIRMGELSHEHLHRPPI